MTRAACHPDRSELALGFCRACYRTFRKATPSSEVIRVCRRCGATYRGSRWVYCGPECARLATIEAARDRRARKEIECPI